MLLINEKDTIRLENIRLDHYIIAHDMIQNTLEVITTDSYIFPSTNFYIYTTDIHNRYTYVDSNEPAKTKEEGLALLQANINALSLREGMQIYVFDELNPYLVKLIQLSQIKPVDLT